MPINKLLPTHSVSTVDPIRDLASEFSAISETRSMSDSSIGEIAFANESLSSEKEETLNNVSANMQTTIKSILDGFNSSIAFEDHQIEAATIGGIVATNPRAAFGSKLKSISAEAISVSANVQDGNLDRGISLEAYDERENRSAQMFSILFNLLASRQDEFGETFFPTVVINPTEVGVLISVKLFYVYNDFKRSVTGSLANYGRMNVIRAYADAEVLKNELTRAVPVIRTGGSEDNTAVFVDTADVPSRTISLGVGTTVTTSPLKVDQKVDLLALSQTNELLNSGLMGPTDNLDAFVKLETLYAKATDGTDTDVIAIDVSSLPGSSFTYAPQGNSRAMLLDLDSEGLVLDADTVKVDGGALEYLTELATNSIRVHVGVNGKVTLDKGDTTVSRGNLSLVTMRNAGGDLVTGSAFNDLSAKIAGLEIIGYDVQAYRANSNIRQRGQLLDTQTEFRIVQVPYRSPIATLAPVMSVSGEADTSALQSLITTTGIRVSNEAVSALLRAKNTLASYKHVANENGDLPELSDIGFQYVKPVFFSEQIDLSEHVDSLKSSERMKDIRCALVEKIRFYATEMYRSSEYKAAADVLTGNVGYKPTVIVGTDPVIYNYIQAEGDLRTLGDKFDVKVVSTLDTRFKGKVAISFGVFDGSRNTSINPLNSGNMLYASELVSNMSVSRDGSTSNELMVTPRFLHLWNLPVMTFLEVSGLPEVVGKVVGYTKEKP